MAILPMRKIIISAMRKNRKLMLEFLQRRGTVEINNVAVSDDVFGTSDTSASRTLFEKNGEAAEKAVAIISRYSEEKKPMLAFLQGREEIPLTVADSFYEKSDTVLKVAQRVLQLERDIDEAKTALVRIKSSQHSLTHWMELPVAQTFKGTHKTRFFIGAIEGEHTAGELERKLAEVAPELEALHVEVVLATKEQTTLYAIALKTEADEAEAALRSIGFARPSSPTHHLPKEKAEMLAKQKRVAEQEIQEATAEIIGYAPRREDIRFLEDHLKMRAEKYGMIDRLMHSRHVFMLQGYIPAEAAEALKEELEEKFICSVLVQLVSEGEDVPVKLKNNWFSEPTESVLESYSMPGKGEIDPTAVMSVFYYLLFGLMFSDAGYGLIMAGACAAGLLIFKNMEPNWNKNLRMFFWCGVSTIFWGIVFSSYFGDVVNVVSKTFFGHEVGIPPLWFAPLDNPMRMLMFCLALGIVHLTTGYAMLGVTLAKNKKYPDILYDAIFPVAILFPLVAVLMTSSIFEGMAGFSITLSPLATNLCLGMAGACCLGVLLFGGRESKNWFKRILKGAYALYNVLAGWLGDILSYSRLLALGLATGVIASVINQLGTLTGGIVGFFIFLIVFLLGNTLNFGINVLGAYVHSNRLEFVEFFGKFYEGGGRKFNPFGIHTKHYKIQEETQNE